MKKICVIFSIVGFVISIQSCKVICPKLCKVCKTQKPEVLANKQVNDSIINLDNLKLFVSTEIVPFYNGNFDILVKKTSLELLQRDKSIIHDAIYADKELNLEIDELEEYQNAKSLLSKKYDSVAVPKSIEALKNKQFAGSETDRMISLLENYSFIKQDLDSLIKEINQKKQMPDVQDFIIYAKISERIFKFLYPDDTNNANMANYPLVLDICNRILKSKREDLNVDISYLLKEN